MTDLVDVTAWDRWLHSRRGRHRCTEWAREDEALAGWSAADLTDPRWSPAIDRMQHGLVALAQRGDADAALGLLVQLRPGLLRLVAARQRGLGERRVDACDEVRAAFHETLYRHPLHRRPRRIAANLVLDTRQRLNRADRRSDATTPAVPPRPAMGADDGVLVPTWLLRRAIERLPGSSRSRAVTAEAAYRAWILDQPRHEVAGALGLRPGALDTRLHRLRQVVRQEFDRAA